MKSLLSTALLLVCLNGTAQRYLTDEFPVLDSIIAGSYGSSIDYQSNSQDLLFDFYEPADDTLNSRPLIIYIHGGGFTSGSRSYPSVKAICRRMATKGYTVANIDYRLDPNFEIYNSNSDRRAMTDAMHDAKQAIRYFKANADTYGIDTNLVFIGGESAGAATSMMAAFVDKQEEMAVYPMADPNNPIGSPVNLEVSNSVAGTLCLCGLILDTLAMELPTDPPILWTHGTEDDFVPISLGFNVVLRALNVGIPITARVYEGATHCPWYFGNPEWATYLDSTISDITNFLYPHVASPLGLSDVVVESAFSVHPNPFDNQINLKLIDRSTWPAELKLSVFTTQGEAILSTMARVNNGEYSLPLGTLKPGVYFLSIEYPAGRSVKRIVKAW